MNAKGTLNGVTMLAWNKRIYVPVLVLLCLFCSGDAACGFKGRGETFAVCTDTFPDTSSFTTTLLHLDIIQANKAPVFRLNPSHFAGNPSLKYIESIRIQNTTLNAVDKNAFSGLKYLHHLDISDNSLLKTFNRESVSGATSLKILLLSGNVHLFNKISGPILFSDSVEELDLSRCEIEYLHKDAFKQLKRLSFLVLSGNKITRIPTGTFSGLLHLTELQLSDNSLGFLPRFMFKNSSSVEVLDLRGNPISDVPADIFDYSPEGNPLLQLDLSETELKSINIPPLQSLVTLNLGGSRVSSLKNFYKFPELKYLNLSYTKLTEIHSAVFENNSILESVILSGNSNLKLPTRFHGSFPYLELMDLSKCGLVSLTPNLFDEMTSIVTLNLSSNALNDSESLGRTLSPLMQLEILDLSHNDLRVIGGEDFSGNSGMRKLLLSGNPFTSPPSLASTPALRQLDLSRCSLTRIHLPAIFRQTPKLRFLSLSDNELRSLTDEAYLDPLEDEDSRWSLPEPLVVLELGGNPLSCDPPLISLIYEVRRMGVVPSSVPPQHTGPAGGGTRDVHREWERLMEGACESQGTNERTRYDVAITLEPVNLPPALEGTVTAKFPIWLTVGMLFAVVLGSVILLAVALRRHRDRVRQSRVLILPQKHDGVKISVSLGSAGGGLKMRSKDYQRLQEDRSPGSPETPRIYRPPPNGGHFPFPDIPDVKNQVDHDEP